MSLSVVHAGERFVIRDIWNRGEMLGTKDMSRDFDASISQARNVCDQLCVTPNEQGVSSRHADTGWQSRKPPGSCPVSRTVNRRPGLILPAHCSYDKDDFLE